MPEAASLRRLESFCDCGCGRRIFAEQESAHGTVLDIGRVQQVEQIAAHGLGRFSEVDEPIDRFGKFRRAARAVAHLAGDEARVDGSPAHNA
jgi:hypothetical protein